MSECVCAPLLMTEMKSSCEACRLFNSRSKWNHPLCQDIDAIEVEEGALEEWKGMRKHFNLKKNGMLEDV